MRPILLLAAAATFLCAGEATDWPRWRGPTSDGFAAVGTYNLDWQAKPPKELWRAKLSSGGHSGIAVAGGQVLIIDHDGKEGVVRAFALADGKPGWTFAFPDADKENFGFDRAPPTIDEGKAYCLGRRGLLSCLDAKTGAKVWQVDLTKDFGARKVTWGITAAPLIDGNAVVVLPGAKDGLLLKLDKKTGKALGKAGGDEQASYATPVIATIGGVRQYVVFSAKRLAGLDAAKGGVLWQHPWTTKYDVNAAAPLILGNAVFITSGYGHGCAMLDIAGGKPTVRWENTNMQAHFSSPLHKDGFIYGNGDPGNLICLDAKDGAVKWSAGGYGKGGVVGLGDYLIAVNGDNGEANLVKLDPAAHTVRGTLKAFTAKGKYWSPPIVADGRLLLRGVDEVVCYDLR